MMQHNGKHSAALIYSTRVSRASKIESRFVYDVETSIFHLWDVFNDTWVSLLLSTPTSQTSFLVPLAASGSYLIYYSCYEL